MLRAFAAWRRRRRSRREHEEVPAYDDQLLADLGITRQDLQTARRERAASEGPVFP